MIILNRLVKVFFAMLVTPLIAILVFLSLIIMGFTIIPIMIISDSSGDILKRWDARIEKAEKKLKKQKKSK